MIRRFLSACSVMLVALLMAGCLDTTETYVVNPDGSGKVTIESTVEELGFGFGDAKKTSNKEQVRKFVADVLDGSSGVDVWKDVECKKLPDGKTWFKGTAYFSDLGDVNLKGVSTSNFELQRQADGTMKILYGKDESEEDTAAAGAPPTLSEEEIKRLTDSAKQSFDMALGLMRPMFGTMNIRTTLRIGGSMRSVEGFERATDGRLRVIFSGKRLMEMMDSVTTQPNFWRDQVIAEASGKRQQKSAEMRKMLFGVDQPSVVIDPAGAKPVFDYKAEVAAARKGYARLLKKYGVKPSGN